MPKLNFDARNDLEFALKFFKKNFIESKEDDKNVEGAVIEEKPK